MAGLSLAAAGLAAAIVAGSTMLFGYPGLTLSIPSQSMVPTFLVGDYLLFPQLFARAPRRGDIVVHTADRGGGLVVFLKRIVGLPGDRVAYRNGVLVLNGQPVPRQPASPPENLPADYRDTGTFYRETIDGVGYDIFELLNDGFLDNTAETTVPPGRYFGLGDNRDNSADSRTAQAGTIPGDAIFGRACLRFRLPFSFRNVCG